VFPRRFGSTEFTFMKTLLAALALLSTAALAAPAQAGGLELGILDCQVDGGTAYVIGSHKGVACTFRPYDNAFTPETYTGVISKLGLDIGHTNGGTISWAVLTATDGYRGGGALAGNYFGTSGEASIVTGGGANLLVGGFQRNFTLQPLSVQTQTGLNLALAVQKLELYRPLK
jgi:hypothetical protein